MNLYYSKKPTDKKERKERHQDRVTVGHVYLFIFLLKAFCEEKKLMHRVEGYHHLAKEGALSGYKKGKDI